MTADAPRRPSPFGEGSTGLGYPTAGPPPSAPSQPSAPGQPGPAIAAAVLGFVAAAMFGLVAGYLVVGTVAFGANLVQALSALGMAVGGTVISAVLAVGSLQVLQRHGPRLLVRGSAVEIGVLLLTAAAASILLDGLGTTNLVPSLVIGAAVGAVRLVLLHRPVVTAWLAGGTPPADDAPLRALLAPHALLLVGAVMALWSATT